MINLAKICLILKLVHCNIASNNYQQTSQAFYTFIPKESFDQSLEISPTNFILIKTFNSKFLYTEVLFTDENSKQLDTEGKN